MRAASLLVTKEVPKFEVTDFESILQRRTVTAATFADVPLAEEATVPRGRVLTALAREVDNKTLHPDARLEDAVAGTSVDGRMRGQHVAPYDWLRDGRRVAVSDTSSGPGASTGTRGILVLDTSVLFFSPPSPSLGPQC